MAGPNTFIFLTRTEFFRQASHDKWCSEIPDKGAGVLEMETPSIYTKASSLKVSLSTSCPAGATVPQPGCPHLQSMTEGNIPNPATRERKQRPRLSEGFLVFFWGGTHICHDFLVPRGNGKPPDPSPFPQRSPTISSFSSSTPHYIFCQPQTGPKLHITATKPRAQAHRARPEGN